MSLKMQPNNLDSNNELSLYNYAAIEMHIKKVNRYQQHSHSHTIIMKTTYTVI